MSVGNGARVLFFAMLVLYPETNLHAAARSSTDAAAAYSSSAAVSLSPTLSSGRPIATDTCPHAIMQRLIENPSLASFFDPLKKIITTEIFRLDRQLSSEEQSSLQEKIIARASSSARHHALIAASGMPLPTIIDHLICHENNKRVTAETMQRLKTLPSALKNHIARFLVHSKGSCTQPSVPKDSSSEGKEEVKSKEETADQTDGSPASVPHLDLSKGVEAALSAVIPAAALCAAAYNSLSGIYIPMSNRVEIIYANDTYIVYAGDTCTRSPWAVNLRVQNYRTGEYYNISYDSGRSPSSLSGTMSFKSANNFKDVRWYVQGDCLGVKDYTCSIINLKTGIKCSIENPDRDLLIAFNDQGSHVAVVQKETIEIYETSTMTRVSELRNTFGSIYNMILTNKTALIISVERNSAVEGEYYEEVHAISPGTAASICLYSKSDMVCPDLVYNEKTNLLAFSCDEYITTPTPRDRKCVHIYDMSAERPVAQCILPLESLGIDDDFIRRQHSNYFMALMHNNLIIYDIRPTSIWNAGNKKHVTCDRIVYLNNSSKVIATQTADTITIFDEQLTPLRTIRLPKNTYWQDVMVNDTGTILTFAFDLEPKFRPHGIDLYIVNLLNNTYYKYSNIQRSFMNQEDIILFPAQARGSRTCAGKIPLKSIEKPEFSLEDAIKIMEYDCLIQSGDIGKLATPASASLPWWEQNIQAYYATVKRSS